MLDVLSASRNDPGPSRSFGLPGRGRGLASACGRGRAGHPPDPVRAGRFRPGQDHQPDRRAPPGRTPASTSSVGQEFYFEAEGRSRSRRTIPWPICGPEGLTLRTHAAAASSTRTWAASIGRVSAAGRRDRGQGDEGKDRPGIRRGVLSSAKGPVGDPSRRPADFSGSTRT